jgi:hypothetical protein
MNRLRYLGFVIFIFSVTLGMGSIGDQKSIVAPEPDYNYTATLIDQSDASLELENLSCNGLTYLTGFQGRAQVSIDFRKIRSIFFFLEDDKIRAGIEFTGGAKTDIFIENSMPWYGQSSFADVRIESKDIKAVHLHGLKQTADQ